MHSSKDPLFPVDITGVNLISAISGLATGGTAAYVRSLGKALASKGVQVNGIARSEKTLANNLRYAVTEANQVLPGPFPTTIISAARGLRFPAGNLGTLFGRPALVKAGAAAAASLFSDPIQRAALPNSEVFHFVGNGWEALGFGALAAARQRNAILVVTPFVHPDNWGDADIDIELYNRADAVLTASRYERDHLISRGVRPEQLQSIDLAPADLQQGEGKRFRERHQLENRPLILFIARKQEYKGYHTLRRALSKVCEAVPNACLIAIGPDATGEPTPPPVADGSFLDLGEIPMSEIQHKADALAAADVFCMPSTAEAFGIVYVEAWAYGMPVVGGPAPAACELIQDSAAGFCVTEQNENQVADHLIRILRDRELRTTMGLAGQQLVHDRYNWETVASRHLQIYGDALLKRRTHKQPKQAPS